MNWFVLAMSAAILTSIAAIIEKKTLSHHHAASFSTMLALFNLVFSVPFLFSADFNISSNMFILIFISSTIGAIAFLLFAKAMRHEEISKTSPILNFRPAVVLLLALIFLKETPSILQIIGIFILIIGAYILEISGKTSFFDPFKKLFTEKYNLLILVSILLYSISAIVDKVILTTVTPSTFLFLVHINIAMILFFVSFIFYGGVNDLKEGFAVSWKWIAVMALVTTAHRFFLAQAFSLANVSLVSSVKNTSTFFTLIIGGFLFKEKNLQQKLLATVILIFGATLIIMGQS